MLRTAIVGCGFMGRMHANVYSTLDNARLTAVADHRPEILDRFAEDFGASKYASLENLLQNEEVDAIDVCLPTHLHNVATTMAARAGKHVFCEKPMALTLDEADEMIAECESTGVRLMIGHCIRFWPEYAHLKKITCENRLGKLLSINLTRYGEFPFWSSDNWLADEGKSGGGALDMHIHDTDFALYLLGEPKEMVSFGSVDTRGVGQIFTTMDYGDTVAHLEGGWNLPAKTPFRMAFRAIFERGAAIMEGGPMTIYEEGKEPVQPEITMMKAAGGGNISDLGGYYHELKYFADCIESDAPFVVSTPQSSRQSLATALEEIRQVRERKLTSPLRG
ncbi:MAG: Gfo/Idh/MocA family protein [Fimbriimonadales bacterium]